MYHWHLLQLALFPFLLPILIMKFFLKFFEQRDAQCCVWPISTVGTLAVLYYTEVVSTWLVYCESWKFFFIFLHEIRIGFASNTSAHNEILVSLNNLLELLFTLCCTADIPNKPVCRCMHELYGAAWHSDASYVTYVAEKSVTFSLVECYSTQYSAVQLDTEIYMIFIIELKCRNYAH